MVRKCVGETIKLSRVGQEEGLMRALKMKINIYRIAIHFSQGRAADAGDNKEIKATHAAASAGKLIKSYNFPRRSFPNSAAVAPAGALQTSLTPIIVCRLLFGL
jgi:hypothetical protein